MTLIYGIFKANRKKGIVCRLNNEEGKCNGCHER